MLVLASASPRRLQLLGRIGLVPDVVEAAGVEESARAQEAPGAMARRLAEAKADSVAGRYPDAFVLAADTVVAVGRRVLAKPVDAAAARACLEMLSGRRHRVWSAVALIAPGARRSSRLVGTVVSFRRLSRAGIDHYVDSQEWRDKAGGYAIQGMAGAFVRRVNGSCSGVVGLPLAETAGLLAGMGWPWPPGKGGGA